MFKCTKEADCADLFWTFLLDRKNDNCLMGCSIKGNGKNGPQVIDGKETGL